MSAKGHPPEKGAGRAALQAKLAKTLTALQGPIAVALSGGGDSLALMHLAADVLGAAAPRQLWAVTVNHQLRPEALAEAEAAGKAAKTRGLRHALLTWKHAGKVPGNLQAAARAARYGLMAAWAETVGVRHILLAHTEDDQAETLLMALARASGLDGLAGLRPDWAEGAVRFHRPLLDIARADLRADLAARGAVWAEDPSNRDTKFQRIRARKALAALDPLGITGASLARVARQMAQVKAALDAALAEAFHSFGAEEAGAILLSRPQFAAAPEELRRRLIVKAVQYLAAAPHPPRAESLARFVQSVEAGKTATLGGVRGGAWQGALVFARELNAVKGLETPAGALWDGRWHLKPAAGAPRGLKIRALGPEGLTLWPRALRPDLPRFALLALPGLWQGPALWALPDTGAYRKAAPPGAARAEITKSFRDFLKEH